MKMKVYTSYDDVDKDLRILKLKAKIKEEKIKLNVGHLKEELSLASIAGNVFGTLIQKTFVTKALGRIVSLTKAKVVGKR